MPTAKKSSLDQRTRRYARTRPPSGSGHHATSWSCPRAAETASATILVTASNLGMPVSTTHSISTAIMGVGFAKNPKALKISVIERIVWAWILTIPGAFAVGWLASIIIRALA